MTTEQTTQRRSFSIEEKKAILEEVDALEGQRGAASQVARKHGFNPSLISNWRKQLSGDGEEATPKPAARKASAPKPSKRKAAPKGNGDAVNGSANDDPVLQALWNHALTLPSLRERFEFLAAAGERTL